jgi:hypothetical protein
MSERLMVYDRTCSRLGRAWSLGGRLYRLRGRIDATYGATSWGDALWWLGARREPIAELQYWGHGKWGRAVVDDDVLDASALAAGHALHRDLAALRERLAPDALVWFRTCETFGARAGIDFAERLADWLRVRVAGHTYVIAFHQSGLHGLRPGMRADWSPEEGLAAGTSRDPERARWSSPFAPRTITCLRGRVPDAWFG